MIDKILNTVTAYKMIEHGDHIVAGLSGGADSVCLLLALNELKSRLDISLSAIHVNHCLRGKESDRDEQFCKDLCRRLDIPLIHRRFDVSGYASEHHMSTELAARTIRYDFFREQTQGKKLATAHNANDNAETVIFNLARGTGIKGISGIPPVRDNIIRPLINITRDEIEQYLNKNSQEYVTDSTNLSDDYTRNKIRHSVIPVLCGINPSLFSTIASDSENFRLDGSYLEQQASAAYQKCLSDSGALCGLSGYHKAVRHRCISCYLKNNNIEVNSRRISEIDDILFSGGKINLRGNIFITASGNVLMIQTLNPEKKPEEFISSITEGDNIFMDRNVEFILSDSMPDGCDAVVDADQLKGSVYMRNRRPGDRIRLSGNSFSSSVKKLFNSSIPADERNNICFICDDEGPVFIERTGISDRVRITGNTCRYAGIKIC